MSTLFIINGGIFNSTISCVMYGDEKDSKSIYEKFNEIFSCVKVPCRSKEDIKIKYTPVNLYRIPKITEEHFISIMNRILNNYFKSSELKDSGIKNFEDNRDNKNIGYKKLFDRDAWFISSSFTGIKKLAIEFMKEQGIETKAVKYPTEIKERKQRVKKVSKKSLDIEDNSDSDTEQPKIEEKKEEKKEEKVKEVKKEIKKISSSKKSSKKSSVSSSDLSDDDNGIMKPQPKDELKKTVKVQQKKPKATKAEEVPAIDSDSDSDSKSKSVSDSDSDISEEILVNKTHKKDNDETDILGEIEGLDESNDYDDDVEEFEIYSSEEDDDDEEDDD